MDERTMPNITFRCSASQDQASLTVQFHARFAGHPDTVWPRPLCPRADCERYEQPMDVIVQVSN